MQMIHKTEPDAGRALNTDFTFDTQQNNTLSQEDFSKLDGYNSSTKDGDTVGCIPKTDDEAIFI